MRSKKYIKAFLLLGCIIISLAGNAQLQEQLYVHTDKAWYHSGEIIWFRIDIVDDAINMPLPASKVAYAEILDASNKPVLQGMIAMENATGSGSFMVPPGVASGSYTFRAYTNWMKNFPASRYFQKNITLINTRNPSFLTAVKDAAVKDTKTIAPTIKIGVSTDKETYTRREKVTLALTSEDLLGKAVSASFSLSVYHIDSLQQPDGYDISGAFSKKGGQDLYSSSAYPHIPELNGHLITGKIVDNKTGQPVPGIHGYLSVPGSKNIFRTAVSDSLGAIKFEVKYLSGYNEIVLQTNSSGVDSNYHIEIDHPYSLQYTRADTAVFQPPLSYPVTLASQSIHAQVQNRYHKKEQHYFSPALFDTLAFYGKPDERYSVEDYIKFSSMEDIFREYIRAVGVARQKGKPYPFVFDEISRKPFNGVPLILLNGVPVFNIEKFMSVEPQNFRVIEAVGRKYFLGKNVFQGIISATTTDTTVAGLLLDNNAVVIDYEGLQLTREFYSPVYLSEEQRKSRIPDFRNTLYWSPKVMTDAKGKRTVDFYTSDLKGKFAIVVQGITASGQTGSKTIFLEVQ